VGRVWASDPASPVHIWLRVCLAKNTLMRFSRVLFLFYFDLWPSKPLFDIRKFQKYVGIIVDLFAGTSRFVFFLFDMLLFRQNQQCSLLQVGCLRSDSIFPFA